MTRTAIIRIGLPGLLAFCLYAWSIPLFFHSDDYGWVVEGRADRLAPLDVFSPVWNGYWRPLSRISFLVENLVHGGDATLAHLLNVLLHAANCCLLSGVLFSLTGDSKVALGTATIFALNTRPWLAVAWVSGRTETLVFLLSLLAIAAFLDWRRRGRKVSFAVMVVCVALALLTKESAIAIVPVLMAVDWCRFDRRPATRIQWVLPHVPLVLLTLASIWIRLALADAHYTTIQATQNLSPVPVVELLEILTRSVSPLHGSGFASQTVGFGILIGLVLLCGRRWAVFCVFCMAASGFPYAVLVHSFGGSAAPWYLYAPYAGAAAMGAAALVQYAGGGRNLRIAVRMALVLLMVVIPLSRSIPDWAAWRERSVVLEDAVREAPAEAGAIALVNLPIASPLKVHSRSLPKPDLPIPIVPGRRGAFYLCEEALLKYVYGALPPYAVIERPGWAPGVYPAELTTPWGPSHVNPLPVRRIR